MSFDTNILKKKKFRKSKEPVLFGLAIIIPFASTTTALIKGHLISPTPYDVTCTSAIYPYWCGCSFCDLDEYSLELCNMIPSGQFGGFTGRFLAWSILVLYFICTVIIFTSLFLVCRTVYVKSKEVSLLKLKRSSGLWRRSSSLEKKGIAQQEYEKLRWDEMKVVFLQALGYVCAFILCSVFPIFSIFSREKPIALQYLHVILRPLQGFFNLLIFMGHKIHNQRRSDKSLTRWGAFCKAFSWKNDDPTIFLDNIALVLDDNENDSKEFDNGDHEHNENTNNKKNFASIALSAAAGISYDNATNTSNNKRLGNKNKNTSMSSRGSRSKDVDSRLSVGLSHDSGRNDDENSDLFLDNDNNTENNKSNKRGGSRKEKISSSSVMSWYSRESIGVSGGVSSRGIPTNNDLDGESRDISYAVSSF